ncbi:MAG: RcnB family protein [Alphaproteobacteria bacterium]|nr:RcnB family protein [Alphaproteobacteria bacterium]
MRTALIFGIALGLVATAAPASASSGQGGAIRLAANDVDKRVVVKERNNGTEMRRTVTERPNGTDVRRTVTERPNGTTIRRTVTDRPNGVNVRVTRKVYRAPRRFHAARPWIAPRGFVYRRFVLGQRVPAVLLAANFFLMDFALYGLEPPPPGYVWVREGGDAVLVNRYTGEVVQVAYDIFY